MGPSPELNPNQLPRDFKDIGFTPKCLGCNALRNGTPNLDHNEECRQRVMEHLESTVVGRDHLEKDEHRTYTVTSRLIEQQEQQQHQQQDMHEKHDSKIQKRQHDQQKQQARHDTYLSSSSNSGLKGSLKRTAEAEGESKDDNAAKNKNKRACIDVNEGVNEETNTQTVPGMSNTHDVDDQIDIYVDIGAIRTNNSNNNVPDISDSNSDHCRDNTITLY